MFHKAQRRRVHRPESGVGAGGTGPYIAFLDADDAFEPAALETLWYLREKAGADSAGCAHYNVTPDGERRTELLLPAGIYEETGIRKRSSGLAGDRLQPPVFNGFIWRFLLTPPSSGTTPLPLRGPIWRDELFLMEYFRQVHRLKR